MTNVKGRSDVRFMRRAIERANKIEKSFVTPNPRVGAVLVKNGRIIAEGVHKIFGGPHAEAETFRNAKHAREDSNGATLYVTLEPCCHIAKKTQPCLPLLLQSGIKRVVVASKDPNPAVNGRSLRIMRKAGIDAAVGVCGEEARALNEEYFYWRHKKQPFVAVKVAMSLDGKIATKTGDSKWITSKQSRALVKKLRDQHDAIVVGSGTVCADDPSLAGAAREPKRIILDSMLRSPLSSKVFRDGNVLVATTKRAPLQRIKAFQKAGISLKVFPKKIRLAPLFRFLARSGLQSVFVEGGAEVFGSCFDERVANKIYWFIAPKIIGGRSAKHAVGGEGVAALAKALQLKKYAVTRLGEDIFIDALFQGDEYGAMKRNRPKSSAR